MTHPKPPQYRSFTTRSKDEAASFLDGLYGQQAKWDFPRNKARFRFKVDIAACGNTTLARGDYSGLSSTRELTSFIQVILPLNGCMKLSNAHLTTAIAGGGPTMGVVCPGRRTQTETIDGMGLAASFNHASLRKRVEQLIGPKVPKSFELCPPDTIDVRSAVGNYFSNLIATSFNHTRMFNTAEQPILAGMLLDETLLNAAAVALCPSLLDLVESTATNVAPDTIRRVREYIDAHFNQPISLAEVAETFGMGVRSMQVAFQKYYQTTPRDFLINRRLEHARRVLVMQTSNSVTQAALESGFTDLSFFSARYSKRFNELPSETLRRAKGLVR